MGNGFNKQGCDSRLGVAILFFGTTNFFFHGQRIFIHLISCIALRLSVHLNYWTKSIFYFVGNEFSFDLSYCIPLPLSIYLNFWKKNFLFLFYIFIFYFSFFFWAENIPLICPIVFLCGWACISIIRQEVFFILGQQIFFFDLSYCIPLRMSMYLNFWTKNFFLFGQRIFL